MKYITLIIGLLVVGCGTPVKELTLEEKVVGTYEAKKDGDTWKFVFLENGIMEDYKNGKKYGLDSPWKLVNRKIHVEDGAGGITVMSINKDGSVTDIAYIYSWGERVDRPKEDQNPYKKIK